ncbi:MAG TPA: LAGLIDADG family homing endonuclease [Bacteroidales bacterium]|nr:LAGLIDADG family homing endonuclease [Bacteroidales bacterium]
MKINRFKYSLKDIKIFADYYKNNHTLLETAKYFNINYKTMINSFIRLGYYKPTRKQLNRKYTILHEDYFSKIDSHEKAYFLGLLMSDGYIATDTYSKIMGITLQLQDEYILEYLKQAINPNSKLHYYKNSVKFRINSTKIYNDLKTLNFSESKSNKEFHIPNINKEFYNSFIAGYFDGDGCITLKKSGYTVCSIISNSKLILEDIQKILTDNNILTTLRIDRPAKNNRQALYILAINRLKEQKKFGEFIYKNTPIYLIRKKEKFMQIPC